MVYCFVGGTTTRNGTATDMNNNCFQDLKFMADISLSLCSSISEEQAYNPKTALKESSDAKCRCIDFAIKQFIPPIDREDITYIALKLHKLNTHLCELAYYKKKSFPKKDLNKELVPLKNVCMNIRKKIEGNCTKADYTDEYVFDFNFHFPENNYSALHLICEYKLYELLKKCTDTALDTNDYLIRTVIKNT